MRNECNEVAVSIPISIHCVDRSEERFAVNAETKIMVHDSVYDGNRIIVTDYLHGDQSHPSKHSSASRYATMLLANIHV